MSLDLRRVGYGVIGAALLAAGSAQAAQYNVIAQAGSQGDSHESLDDPVAEATFLQSGGVGGAATYGASADLSAGTLAASVSITGGNQMTWGFVGAGRSSGRFEETIAFQQSLAGPVTISASILAGLDAGTPVFSPGFPAVAQAFASLDVAGCRTTLTKTNGIVEDTSLCDNEEHGWQSGAGYVVVVIDPAVFPGTTEVGLEAQVSAQFINPGFVSNGVANATAGVALSVSPDVPFEFTGSQTAFPVPEPAGGWSAALLALGLARRRHDRMRARRSGRHYTPAIASSASATASF